ncbi:TonB-dependent receptor [Caulobacter flavus]|uniref:TonB-dependent receptor n=1 Tax=Caulobacter flavus TaxID=1679497 RepID=UPI000F4391A5|nr:TonB-dependent receptor [Caulobacter flavus]
MTQTPRLRRLLAMGASAAVLTAVAAPAAFAQTQVPAKPASDNVIEELVVTAQKKEEALQDVPIAVSAFSQDSLEAQKIDGGPNLQQAIPNVSFGKSNFTNSFNFQIRGIGSKGVGVSADNGVGVHVNNAPLQASNLFEAEFYDVERVEVLRGPQGTLYGRNATGGVVNIITAKPADRFEALGRVEYGNYDTKKVRGMVNIPIVEEKMALRIAGALVQRDGFVTNTFNNKKVDDRDLYSTRVSLAVNPNERLRVNLMWEHFKEDDNRARIGKQLCTKDDGPATVGGVATGTSRRYLTQGCASASLYSNAAYGTVNTSGTLYGVLGNLVGFTSGDLNAGDTVTRDLREIETRFDPIYRSTSDVYQFNFAYDLTDQLTFTSLSSISVNEVYSKQDYFRNISPGTFNSTALTPGGNFTDPQTGTANTFLTYDISSSDAKQISQEFRLQSAFDGPINFNVGGIYFDYKGTTDYYVVSNGLTISALALNFQNTGNPNCNPATTANCIGIDTSPTPNGQGHNYFDNRTPYHLKATALFGEVYWQASEDLKFTLGLRQTHDRKTTDNISTALLAPGYGLVTGTPAKQVSDFKELTGRLGFDYKANLPFTDETLLYAFYSKGYKGGGANPPGAIGVAGVAATYQPEFVNAYEIGAKNTLLGGSLMLNATGFYYDYKGYQISKIVNRTSVNENIDAKVWGVELETLWQPVKGLRLNANVGYLNTQIKDGVSSIDVMNRTQGDPALTLVKAARPTAALGSNCVLTTAGVATIIGSGLGGTLPLACAGPGTGASSYYSNLANTLYTLPTASGGAGLTAAQATAVQTILAAAGGPAAGASTLAGALISQGFTPAQATGLVTVALTANTLANGVGLYNYAAGASIDGRAADLSGNELPNSPHWTLSLGAQYSWDLPAGWGATLRGDYYRQSEQYARIYNTEYDRLKSWENVNLTLKIEKPELGLSIDAYVKNLLNKTPITDAYTTDDTSGLFTNVYTLEPRLYGVSLTKTW